MREFLLQGQLRPSKLLDTDENYSNNWGSLVFGTIYVNKLFKRSISSSLLVEGLNYTKLVDAFKHTWTRYNAGPTTKNVNAYGRNIANNLSGFKIEADTDPFHNNYLSSSYHFFVEQNGYY